MTYMDHYIYLDSPAGMLFPNMVRITRQAQTENKKVVGFIFNDTVVKVRDDLTNDQISEAYQRARMRD
jgi:hypothetical protein